MKAGLICLCPAEVDYHPACLQHLFERTSAPGLDLDLLHFPVEQWKMAGNVSISGLQPKLSMALTPLGTLITVERGGQSSPHHHG